MSPEVAPNDHRNAISKYTIKSVGSSLELTDEQIDAISYATENGYHELLCKMIFAVLNAGSEMDDPMEIRRLSENFVLNVKKNSFGLDLYVENAPKTAFVDEKIILGIREHIESVLEYLTMEIEMQNMSQDKRDDISVHKILKDCGVLDHGNVEGRLDRIVCWGGHAVKDWEYRFSKAVGYHLGLRGGVNIVTGCGSGIMKGPMKGALVAHEKQRIRHAQYLGVTEPKIIAVEAPNSMINPLIIMPNIEKRQEAFVRYGDVIVVFPGGVGTIEELLYAIALNLHPDNQENRLKIVVAISNNPEHQEYKEKLENFIKNVFGNETLECLQFVPGDAEEIAKQVKILSAKDRAQRQGKFDLQIRRNLNIPEILKKQFDSTHENVSKIKLSKSAYKELWEYVANVSKAFSAFVAGNIKADTVEMIQKKGPFQLHGDANIAREFNIFLQYLVKSERMKIKGEYKPCYDIIPADK